MAFSIASAKVADTDDGEVWSSRVQWLDDRTQSIREVLEAGAETSDARSATSEAAGWLEDYLLSRGGTDSSKAIKDAGHKAGHSVDALKRARQRLKARSEASGFPRQTYWTLPTVLVQSEQPSGSKPGETSPTAPTAPTGPVSAVSAVGAVGGDPPRAGLTGPTETPVNPVSPVRSGPQEPEPTAGPTGSSVLGRCTRCGGVCVRYGPDGSALCPACQTLAVAS